VRFTGRSRELGLIRGMLDAAEPVVVRISGLSGVGKSALAKRAVSDYAGFVHRCPPAPDPGQRARLSARIRERGVESGFPEHNATWEELFRAILDLAHASDRPFVLTLDDTHRLMEARSRFTAPLIAMLTEARASGTRLHVVLIGQESSLSALDVGDVTSPPIVRVAPLPLRAAASHLPGSQPYEVVRAYGVFGGLPRVLSALDTSVTVGTNVRRLLLPDAGPLSEAPLTWLEREIQTPSRYVAILETLSRGEADWAAIHDGVPDLTRSGQVAPYLNRLIELGLISARRSLDAGPRTRGTRYAITDPFVAFWFRFIFPWRFSEQAEELGPHYARAIRPGINEHLEKVFPAVCRQHMTFDSAETLGSVPREGGSLWGGGTDIPIAGTLRSGAAYYGSSLWAPPNADGSPLTDLDAQVRGTRYGFGRERRLRLVFTGRDTPTRLRREIARRHDTELIDAAALIGAD